MPRIECLVVHESRLLLTRRPPSERVADSLRPISGEVEEGEVPLHASTRIIAGETGLQITPSCAAVILNDDAAASYCLIFVAEIPSETLSRSSTSTLEWVPLNEVATRLDLSELNRALIPTVLGVSAPIVVALDVGPDGAQRIKETAPIDLARLSPLVFAVTSHPGRTGTD